MARHHPWLQGRSGAPNGKSNVKATALGGSIAPRETTEGILSVWLSEGLFWCGGARLRSNTKYRILVPCQCSFFTSTTLVQFLQYLYNQHGDKARQLRGWLRSPL